MLSFFNVLFMACLIGPFFLFSEMARWQRIGYVSGCALWVWNSFVIGSGVLGLVALITIVISAIQVVAEYFPFRAG
ncbi:MAG: hypothetical protein ACOC8E_03765 [Planctomycetota bacterium]